MKLSELIKNMDVVKVKNFTDVEIEGISYNSNQVCSGDIFICLVGEHTDGHKYAEDAVSKGAVALFTQKESDLPVPQIIVKDTLRETPFIASNFCNHPSQRLNLIGITGTNGKTTVTHLIQKILEDSSKKCALIGTLGYKLSSADEYKEAKHTTPQSPDLQRLLKLMADEKNVENVVMEVSSHSLEQNRVGCCEFNGAVLTNLTQDHLDYHITMDKYFEAKALLFKNLRDGFAVLNADDEYFSRFMSEIDGSVKIFTYGIKNEAHFKATDIEFSPRGASFTCITPMDEIRVQLNMNGMFSIYNVLAAITAAYSMNIKPESAIETLCQMHGVAGRFEIVNKHPLVIVDYAHTPDGLENVLNAAKEITPQDAELICLFGCGGDRDATKRPKMGRIAEKLSDKVVITSDNPRSEDPQQIITDILTGLNSVNPQTVIVEPDRGKAISLLKTLAKDNDVIVIAGKGHEDYQILKDKTIHFDDREEARKVFSGVCL